MAWGLGLGCNGVVRVLVEPLAPDSLYVEVLRCSCEANAASVLVATVYQSTPSESASGVALIETGARLLIDEDGNVRSDKFNGALAGVLECEIRALAHEEVTSGTRTLDIDDSAVTVFIETLLPPVPLIIFGAGHDAMPVVDLARSLGWQTEIVDPQSRPATRSRFAAADKVTLVRPEEVAAHVRLTSQSLTLLMSHNYSHDMALLRFLLASPARYIGVMGPRKRTERMLHELAAGEDLFRPEEADLARLYSPAGLDIGANAPAEIALSIIAEMRAVLEGRRGGMLRERRGSIHGIQSDRECLPLTDEQALTVAVA
jgi:xanthine/CO dehydrogenase XdhC/CoxF family maturation factor